MKEDDDFGFRCRATRDGRVLIERHGALVAVISGTRARRFLARSPNMDEREQQLALARLTGNYRRGNERPTRRGSIG
jgi:hypothetical protein